MKVVVLFSGAKDSTFAIYKAKQIGHEITSLVTLIPENPESYMFHHPNAEWTTMQAESMGIPIMIKKTAGEKEKELDDLESVLREAKKKHGIGGVVSGALASKYQKSRIDGICERLGLEPLAPLWGTDPEEHWNNILGAGFEVIITAVASDGLGKEWLGRKIDTKALQELKTIGQKYGFNLAGEGGEFETFVLNGPIFRKPLCL
ncbi:diphthine--ammonia ligase [Candidatus Aenigmatarchaeota archaeon]